MSAEYLTPPPLHSRRQLLFFFLSDPRTQGCTLATLDMMALNDSQSLGCSYKIQIWKYTYLIEENIRNFFHILIDKKTIFISTCRQHTACIKFKFSIKWIKHNPFVCLGTVSNSVPTKNSWSIRFTKVGKVKFIGKFTIRLTLTFFKTRNKL